jgi:hypothetical protein
MPSFQEFIPVYRKQMELGALPKVYRGILNTLLGLRKHFADHYPQYNVPGGLYQGYMDMSYFSLFPENLKKRNLKIALVFLHESFRFEVWLAGVNKQVQGEYWRIFRESGWDKYRLVPTIEGQDSILECILVETPDFSDIDRLTTQIEQGVHQFIEDIEEFFAAD